MRDFKKAALSFVKLLNVLLMMFSFAFIWLLSYDEAVRAETTVQIKALLLIITMILYVVLGRIYDAFLIGHERITDIVYSQTLTIVIVDVCSYFLQWLNTGNPPKLLHYLLILPIQLLFSVAWAYCSNCWYYRNFPPKRALIISKDDEATRRLLRIKSFSKKYIFEKSMTTDELLRNYSSALDNIDVVFLLNTQNAWAVMQICAFRGVTVYRVPLVSEIIASRSKTVTLFHTPMLRMDGYHPDASYLFLKRCMDIVISGIALLILSPVMLIVAAAIKLEDKGPVFYR